MLTEMDDPEEGPSVPTQKLSRLVEPTPVASSLAPYEVSPITTPTGQSHTVDLVLFSLTFSCRDCEGAMI